MGIRALKTIKVSLNIFAYLVGESALAVVLPRLADLRLAIGVELEVSRALINIGARLGCSCSLRFLGLLSGDKVRTVCTEATVGLGIVKTTHLRHVAII
jgi:hypothetical protein